MDQNVPRPNRFPADDGEGAKLLAQPDAPQHRDPEKLESTADIAAGSWFARRNARDV